MTQNGPKITPNGPKLPQMAQKWRPIYALFPQFFFTEKAVLQTFSLLECMLLSIEKIYKYFTTYKVLIFFPQRMSTTQELLRRRHRASVNPHKSDQPPQDQLLQVWSTLARSTLSQVWSTPTSLINPTRSTPARSDQLLQVWSTPTRSTPQVWSTLSQVWSAPARSTLQVWSAFHICWSLISFSQPPQVWTLSSLFDHWWSQWWGWDSYVLCVTKSFHAT